MAFDAREGGQQCVSAQACNVGVASTPLSHICPCLLPQSQTTHDNEASDNYEILLNHLWDCWENEVWLPTHQGHTYTINLVNHLVPPYNSHRIKLPYESSESN